MPVIVTDPDGEIITVDPGGQALVPNVATTNFDTQLFDFSVNLLSALVWQYNNAVNLQSIIQKKQDWYDVNQQEFWESWIVSVFDLRTADNFGLNVWAIILNMPTFVTEGATPSDVLSWGFDDGSGQFDNSTFGTSTGDTNLLPISTKRIALQLRYFQLCSSGTVPEINRFMNYIFANYGKVILLDNLDMTQEYLFYFPLTWDLSYLFQNLDLLPRPAGVETIQFRDTTGTFWGFDAGSGQFDNSNFAS
jgi:hypothetical protein